MLPINALAPQKPAVGRDTKVIPEIMPEMSSVKARAVMVSVALGLSMVNSSVTVSPAPTGSVKNVLLSNGSAATIFKLSDAAAPGDNSLEMIALVVLV